MSERTHQRRPAGEWRALIERQAQSGLSQAAFCHAEGVALSTFTYWKRRLRSESAEAPGESPVASRAPLFTPLGALPVSESPEDEPVEDRGWTLDLDLGGGLRLTLRKVA